MVHRPLRFCTLNDRTVAFFASNSTTSSDAAESGSWKRGKKAWPRSANTAGVLTRGVVVHVRSKSASATPPETAVIRAPVTTAPVPAPEREHRRVRAGFGG